MGMWSDANTKPDSAMERLANRVLASNRCRGGDQAQEVRDAAEGMRSMPGGETPRRGRGRHGASERLSRPDRRGADKILKAGKPAKGNK